MLKRGQVEYKKRSINYVFYMEKRVYHNMVQHAAMGSFCTWISILDRDL